MDSDDWATSGVSFNPYQCFLASLEVGPRVAEGRELRTIILCLTPCLQSYPSLIETPHEALMAKLQKTESSTSTNQLLDIYNIQYTHNTCRGVQCARCVGEVFKTGAFI